MLLVRIPHIYSVNRLHRPVFLRPKHTVLRAPDSMNGTVSCTMLEHSSANLTDRVYANVDAVLGIHWTKHLGENSIQWS
jgi:hypothetical protein